MDDYIPEQFLCPITLEIMKEPVICSDGHTYEKEAIMSLKKSISPLTNQPINLNTIIPNRIIKELISNYLMEQEKKKSNPKTNNVKLQDDDDELYRLGILRRENEYLDNNEAINQEQNYDPDEELYKLGILKRENKKIDNIRPSTNPNEIKIKSIEEIFSSIGQIKKDIEIYFMECIDKKSLSLYVKPMLNNDIDYIEWLYNENTPIHKSLYLFTILNKLEKSTQWMIDKNLPLDEMTMNLAVSIGNKDLVLWVLSNGCGFGIYTLSYSLVSNNSNFINWLIKLGCFWGCLEEAHKNIIYSNKEISNLLTINNCPWII